MDWFRKQVDNTNSQYFEDINNHFFEMLKIMISNIYTRRFADECVNTGTKRFIDDHVSKKILRLKLYKLVSLCVKLIGVFLYRKNNEWVKHMSEAVIKFLLICIYIQTCFLVKK